VRTPVALLLALFVIPPAAARAEPAQRLDVFAAASLTAAFDGIAHRFEELHPGVEVRVQYAGSQMLAAQIEQGARADVYASADDRWMADAKGHGLIEGDAVTFAHNALVVMVPRTNPGRIRGLRNVASEEESVKSIVGKVQLGEADAGIVYRSDDSHAARRFTRVIEIPAAWNVTANYPIAVVAHTEHRALAHSFVDLVMSKEGQAILARERFTPVTPVGRVAP
jgi:molybdate transport system substrate-binding protein